MPSFAEGLLVPAAQRVSLALAGGLGLIVVAERHHLRDMTRRLLFVRWRTWAITAPLFGAAVMGPVWLGAVFVSALSFQGLREYAALVDLPRRYRTGLYAAGIVSAPVAVLSITVWRALPPVLLILATLPPLFSQDVRNGVRHLAFTILGFAYVPWLLTYFVLAREHVDGGKGILLALGTAVAVSDVAAFVTGKLAGRHPLAPELSPTKTWEGVAGNLVGAAIGIALMGFAIPSGLNPVVKLALPAVVAAGAVWGDLLESLIKRQFGVKDTGGWLPGFGGLLDRIDSLLVVLPLAYTVLVVWG